jgi:hypothetical protein
MVRDFAPVRMVFTFGRDLQLIVIACSRAPTMATWWWRDSFVGMCRGGVA